MTINIAEQDYGLALHTALRKCCTRPTTIAYNIICLMNEKTWKNFVDHIRRNLDREKPAEQELKRVALAWKPLDRDELDGPEFQKAVILEQALRLFSNADWVGFAALLHQDVEVPKCG